MTVITLSRQYGSGGDEVAAHVCDMLGYRFFTKEMMAQTATEMDISSEQLFDFSEDQYQMRSFLDRLLGPAQITTHLETLDQDLPGALIEVVETLDEDQSIALVRRAIQAVAEQDNIVIVGRGGQAILKDTPHTLHVRVLAPLNKRVDRLCRRTNFSLAGAQDRALKHDRASAAYLKRFYGVDWADPMLYDLVINTGSLDTVTAARLIVAAAEQVTKEPQQVTT